LKLLHLPMELCSATINQSNLCPDGMIKIGKLWTYSPEPTTTIGFRCTGKDIASRYPRSFYHPVSDFAVLSIWHQWRGWYDWFDNRKPSRFQSVTATIVPGFTSEPINMINLIFLNRNCMPLLIGRRRHGFVYHGRKVSLASSAAIHIPQHVGNIEKRWRFLTVPWSEYNPNSGKVPPNSAFSTYWLLWIQVVRLWEQLHTLLARCR